MSDDNLRELERRWRTSGSHEDEAIYLSERIRAGLVDPHYISLAAFLDHPATEGCEAWKPAKRVRKSKDWKEANARGRSKTFQVMRFGGLPHVLLLRLACDLGERSLPACRSEDLDVAQRAYAATRAWVACPCRQHADAAFELAQEAFELADAAAEARGAIFEAAREAVLLADPGADLTQADTHMRAAEAAEEEVAVLNADAATSAISTAAGVASAAHREPYLEAWAASSTGAAWGVSVGPNTETYAANRSAEEAWQSRHVASILLHEGTVE